MRLCQEYEPENIEAKPVMQAKKVEQPKPAAIAPEPVEINQAELKALIAERDKVAEMVNVYHFDDMKDYLAELDNKIKAIQDSAFIRFSVREIEHLGEDGRYYYKTSLFENILIYHVKSAELEFGFSLDCEDDLDTFNRYAGKIVEKIKSDIAFKEMIYPKERVIVKPVVEKVKKPLDAKIHDTWKNLLSGMNEIKESDLVNKLLARDGKALNAITTTEAVNEINKAEYDGYIQHTNQPSLFNNHVYKMGE